MKVLVCDDIDKRGRKTADAISTAVGHCTTPLTGDCLKSEIAGLFERAHSLLGSAKSPKSAPATDLLHFRSNDYDIAILDNNLSDLNVAGARHTAESIAGYLRAFGTIPYIVSLNKNPQVDFDLRYLVGDYQTQADLAVNDKHLSNRALWTGDPQDATDGFLPWYWPSLNDAADRRRRQIEFVERHLGKPILQSMGFPVSASDHLSRHAKGALSPEAERVTRITFMKFFETSCRSLPIRKERQMLGKKANAGDTTAYRIVSRVVAGEIEKWVRRDLVGPQDVLVDLPHLLMRMPFLLGTNAGQLPRWNEAIAAMKPPYGMAAEIHDDDLKLDTFADADIWTKSPCFWWRALKSNDRLNRMFYEDAGEWIDAVFCEDLSRFKSSSSESDSKPSEFATELEGPWNRRHVAYIKGQYAYMPMSRFAK